MEDIFKVQKGGNLQPRILYSARLSFRLEKEIKNISDKQKLKEYSNTKPILKEILKGLLKTKEGRIYRKGENHYRKG